MAYRKRISTSYSEDRLEWLIQKRINANLEEKQKIDEHIWNLFWEDWTIMFTDLSGFSRNVAEFWIIHFIQTIFESQRIFIPIIEDYDWILLKVEWDSFMIIFRNPLQAVECWIEMQKRLEKYNLFREDENEKIFLCLWIWYGKVIRIWDDDVFWEEVNSASKLWEDTAKSWQIYITKNVMEKIKNISSIKIEEMKNILPKSWSWYRIIY